MSIDQATTAGPPRRAFACAEVAEQLGVSPDQVRHLIRAGKLRARCTGKRYIIPAAAVEDFLDGADDPMGDQA